MNIAVTREADEAERVRGEGGQHGARRSAGTGRGKEIPSGHNKQSVGSGPARQLDGQMVGCCDP